MNVSGYNVFLCKIINACDWMTIDGTCRSVSSCFSSAEGYTRQGREAVSYHMHLEAATDEFGLCLGIYVSDIPDSGLTFMSHKIPAEAVRDVS